MICNHWDVVDVPFPFSDLPKSKRRKALVLSNEYFNRENGVSILAMITSAEHSHWYLDVELAEWQKAGLRKFCVVRMKLFTLDNRLIQRRTGNLTAVDRRKTSGKPPKVLLQPTPTP